MTNVIKIDDAQIRRDKRIREQGGFLFGALKGSVGKESEHAKERARIARERKSEELRANLIHAITELAIHDGPLAMIDFAFPKIKAYRTGSCSNE